MKCRVFCSASQCHPNSWQNCFAPRLCLYLRLFSLQQAPHSRTQLRGQDGEVQPSSQRALEHDPEKHALGPRPDGWVPVFPQDKREAFARRSCSNKKIERDDDSKKSHPALANTRMSCLARKFVGPGQRRLAGERIEKNCRSRRVGGVVRQFQTSTPRRRHRLRRAEDLERRPPPPCRSRRSRVFGDRAPSGEFLHGAFKLHICGLMHRNPPDPPR